jgi:5'-3' exoribonuclease 2
MDYDEDDNELSNKKMENLIINNSINFINDFIFICFLLGNDFVPNIVSLSLKTPNKKMENGLDILFEKYGDVFREINSNKTDFTFIIEKNCSINFNFFKKLSLELNNHERSYLTQVADSKKFYLQPSNDLSPCEAEIFKLDNLSFKINDPVMLGKDLGDKERYYKHYYNIDSKSNKGKEEIKKMCNEYLFGLYWINNYYLKDCIDWTWCFPHHFGLFMSDIYEYLCSINEKTFNEIMITPIENNYNKIKPFEQLMMVLPRQLAFLLPIELKKVLLNDMVIKKYSPTIFEQDMLYKSKLWQAIPFIDMIDLDYIKNKVLEIEINQNDINRNKTRKIYENEM